MGVGSIGGGEVLEGDVTEESGLCAVRMYSALTCFNLRYLCNIFSCSRPAFGLESSSA